MARRLDDAGPKFGYQWQRQIHWICLNSLMLIGIEQRHRRVHEPATQPQPHALNIAQSEMTNLAGNRLTHAVCLAWRGCAPVFSLQGCHQLSPHQGVHLQGEHASIPFHGTASQPSSGTCHTCSSPLCICHPQGSRAGMSGALSPSYRCCVSMAAAWHEQGTHLHPADLVFLPGVHRHIAHKAREHINSHKATSVHPHT